jgi:glycosyl transferase family 25
MTAATPIFIISLARSRARRDAMRDQVARLGLTPIFVDAVDGTNLAGAEGLNPRSFGRPGEERPLTSRELACALSHCAVYERIVREQIPLAGIFEDDCLLSDGFARVMQAIGQERDGWDVLLLGHHSARHAPADGAETCYRNAQLVDGYCRARVAEMPMGAYAYVATLAGARKLLAFAQPPRMPADWVVGYSPAAAVRLHAVKPPCVLPHPDVATPSTIDDRPYEDPGSHRPWRIAAGRLWLEARKLGILPGSYAGRFR